MNYGTKTESLSAGPACYNRRKRPNKHKSTTPDVCLHVARAERRHPGPHLKRSCGQSATRTRLAHPGPPADRASAAGPLRGCCATPAHIPARPNVGAGRTLPALVSYTPPAYLCAERLPAFTASRCALRHRRPRLLDIAPQKDSRHGRYNRRLISRSFLSRPAAAHELRPMRHDITEPNTQKTLGESLGTDPVLMARWTSPCLAAEAPAET